MIRTTLALAALLALTTMASADPVSFVFGFEGQPVNTPMTSATIVQDGWTFTITRAAGFEFVDLSPFAAPDGVPGAWGSRSLSPFPDSANPEAFALTLDVIPAHFAGVLTATGEFGDFLPSDLDRVTFGGAQFMADNTDPTAFFKSGLAASVPLPFVGGTMLFGGGSAGFEQSLFWDQLTLMAVDDLPTSVVAPPLPGASDPTGGAGGIPVATTNPVPEPASLLLVALGAAAVILRRRRRRG